VAGPDNGTMRIVRIPKRNGKFRTIYIPDKEEMIHLRAMLPTLHERQQRLDVLPVLHGFVPGRSPVSNAEAHIGWKYTLCFDLADFFDSVTPSMIPGFPLPEICFPDGAARQGLPTSPVLANLAASPMDRTILQLIAPSRFGRLCVYTRYADDLSFSFNEPGIGKFLLRELPDQVRVHGFALNPSKTRMQAAVAGRRMITGVGVGRDGLHVPRAIRRRIRAAAHQHRPARLSGLLEWAQLKLPKVVRVERKAAQDRERLNFRSQPPPPAELHPYSRSPMPPPDTSEQI
jgi:RNA-directed DNA polymerase